MGDRRVRSSSRPRSPPPRSPRPRSPPKEKSRPRSPPAKSPRPRSRSARARSPPPRSPPRSTRSPPPRSPPRSARSPPPRSPARSERPLSRRRQSRDRRDSSGDRGRAAPRNPPAKGKYKITVEGIPTEMTWTELKDLGRQSGGGSLTFARTYRSGNRNCGMIEFSEQADADAAIRDLDDRKLEGMSERCRAYEGDAAAEGNLGSYKGRGQYEGKDKDDRRGSSPRRSRTPPRRRSRTPPRRRSRTPPRRRSRSRRRSPPRRGRGEDEEIMTLFVKDLPDDCKEDDVKEDIDKAAKVLRVMLMKKNDQCSAFVRFGSVKDAERAMDELKDGSTKVCGKKVNADMARRNTDV